MHTLTSQGYDDVDSLTDITWEDLEEIGIKRLGEKDGVYLFTRSLFHKNKR